MSKIIEIGNNSRKKLIKGINTLADAVVATLGPGGRNAIYMSHGEIRSTKDGVTVARNIDIKDPIENIGAGLIKQASFKTADNAGDGTTTSTLLAREMINKGMKYVENGSNVVKIKKGIDKTVNKIIIELDKIKQDISEKEQLKQVAIISSNNDIEIGNIIATALDKVGTEGSVHIEESKSDDTYLEIVEGMQFERGYKSHFFVTDNNTMTCQLNEPLVLITDKRLNSVKEILPVLEYVSTQGKSLLIVAEDIEGEALSTLIVNKIRGTLKVVAVKAPDFGDRRKLILEDLAILTGGQVVTDDKGMKFDEFQDEWFGKCQTITITKDKTTIVDGKGNLDKIKERIKELKIQIEKSSTAFEKEKLQERLSKMAGGVALVYIGGHTETEIKEKKDRAEDALYATQAAIEDGILPGGGSAFLHILNNWTSDIANHIDEKLGESIVLEAIKSPFFEIHKNLGLEESYIYSILNKIKENKDNWIGYNINLGILDNMKSIGVIDPTKVTKNALLNAASVASTTLLTECVIVEEQEKENNQELF